MVALLDATPFPAKHPPPGHRHPRRHAHRRRIRRSRATTRSSSFAATASRASATPPRRRSRRARRVIDLSNATVLPGLIDSPHPHLPAGRRSRREGGYDVQLLKYPLAFRAARATVSARRALEQGFTTIRDLETEGAGYGDVGHQAGHRGGLHPRARACSSSTRAISTTGGYPLEGYAPELDVPKGVQIVDGPVEARKAAREQLDHGADWIKVYMTHRSWVDKNGQPGVAAHAHAGGDQGDRRRSARLGQEGRLPRL